MVRSRSPAAKNKFRDGVSYIGVTADPERQLNQANSVLVEQLEKKGINKEIRADH